MDPENRGREIDRFLSELSAAWIPARDVATLVRITADSVGKYLQVSRVTFGRIAPDASWSEVEFSYAYGGSTVTGTYSLKDLLTETARAEFVVGKPLIIADVNSDSRTEFARHRYEQLRVRAFVSVPLRNDKGLQAALSVVATTSPRNWQAGEVQILEHVAARLWPAVERARAENELRRTLQREEFLLGLFDALRPLSDPVAIQEVAARLLGEHLRVNRVIYAETDGDTFIVRRSYAKGVAPFIGSGKVSSFGSVFLEAYERGEGVIYDDIRTDPRFTESERAVNLAGEIVAFAGVLVMKSGRCVGAFAVHSATARVWTSDEITLIRDVAERTWDSIQRAHAEAALREREQGLRLILDASRGGAWTWDPMQGRVSWDERWREIYGYPADEPAAIEGWVSRLHPDDRDRMLRSLDETLKAPPEQAFEYTYRILRPDGTLCWVQSMGRAYRDLNGQVLSVTGMDLDVTERRRAEDALLAQHDEEHDRTLRLLLETAAQGILSLDEKGVIVTANRALEEMFGWPRGALVGRSIDELLPQELRGRMPDNTTLTGLRQDGSVFPIEISINHIATQSGGHAIAFVTDISARTQAEEALRRSHAALEERTAELERRTSQLSRLTSELTLAEQNTREQLARTLHDGLQQLLVSASLGLARLKKRSSPDTEETRLLTRAQDDLDKAITASRSLSLELSPPTLHVAGLPVAISWLANRMQEKYGLEVQAMVDPLANSDRKDVRTLVFESLRELLFNAVKHAQVDRVGVTLTTGPDDTLQVSVTDDGVGFDPAMLFTQANSQTAGWGLLSIRERLTLLGGRFEVTSSPGRGTHFQLIAPRGSRLAVKADKSVLNERSRPPVQSETPSSPKLLLRILVVDDYPGLRQGLRQILEDRPEFQVVGEASNGLEAIAQASSLHPDVIIMDISMPEMDGIEATRRIHAELPLIKIFGLSAHEFSAHALRQAGGVDCFHKGTDVQRLVDRLLSVQTEKGVGRKAAT